MSGETSGRVRVTIRMTGLTATGLGVVLSPIPLADELVLVPVYAGMATAIGRAHGLGPAQVPWRKVGAAIAGGLGARAVANLAFAFVPGVAAVANAVSAAVLTELVGRYVDGACREAAAPAREEPAAVAETVAVTA